MDQNKSSISRAKIYQALNGRLKVCPIRIPAVLRKEIQIVLERDMKKECSVLDEIRIILAIYSIGKEFRKNITNSLTFTV